jgi:hypothetical protein
MVFTLEQNKFITMSYYRNGVKRDGEWTYSVQACKEEFLTNYLDQNVLEKSLAAHLLRIVNRFVTTGSVEKGKSSGGPEVMEHVVENIRDHLEEHPRTSLTRLSLQTCICIHTKQQLYKSSPLMILKIIVTGFRIISIMTDC